MKSFRKIAVLVVLIWVCGNVYSANPSGLLFKAFKHNPELPTKTITSIYCDRQGSIWFGSPDGLIRYDGHQLKTFRSTSKTPGKLISNEILSISADSFDRIWVGTAQGVMLIDPNGYTVSQPAIPPLKGQRINSILTDHEGVIWLGTAANGIVQVNPKNMDFVHYSMHSETTFKLRSNNIMAMYEDSYNRIWVTTWKEGISLISANRKNATYLRKAGNTDNAIRVFEDKDGLIWIATWDDGIFYVRESNDGFIQFERFNVSKSSRTDLDNIVYGILQDPHFGYVWLLTYRGMVCAQKNTDGSITLIPGETFFSDKTQKTINHICLDRAGNIWLGSIAEGVFHMSFNDTGKTDVLLRDPDKLTSLPPHVNKTCAIPGQDLLISVDRAGPFWFNLKTGRIRRTNNAFLNGFKSVGAYLYLKKSNELLLSHLGQDKVYVFQFKNGAFDLKSDFSLSILPKAKENSISQMFEDSRGDVWFATRNGLYLKQMNEKSRKITNAIRDIISITEDKQHAIWVGTLFDGLYKISKSGTDNEYTYKKVLLTINKLECVNVQSVYSASSGLLYAGTYEGCLFSIDPVKMNVEEISSKYGITENAILEIQEDGFGNLWLMTKINLLRYNPKTKITNNFAEEDNTANDFFFKNTVLKLDNGDLLFGGNKGVSVIHPTQHFDRKRPLNKNVQITDILINSTSIFDFDKPLKYNKKSKKLFLKYDQNSILIKFSAFDYLADNNIKYAYMLVGLDKDWQYGSIDQHQVNYSGLNFGHYTFLVKASDSEGIWSREATVLNITILPPFYLSWYAKLFYVLVFFFVLYVIFRVNINKLDIQNELKIAQIDQKKSEELTQTKLQYFTNISHELLTPLSIISLQIEKLNSLKQIDPRHFHLIKNNIFRLKKLASQILTFKKAESGNLKLAVSKNCIIQFVRKIVEVDFKPQFEEKQIRFLFSSEVDTFPCYFDTDKIDKILYNLVSNACKFTPMQGTIHLSISISTLEGEDFVQLTLQDTGCGMDPDELPYIFNRFYISKNSNQSESHGIGLSLTKELVEIHHGQITVSSIKNVGTTFILRVPVSISSFAEDELLVSETDESTIEQVTENKTDSTNKPILSTKDFLILLVEDNQELRTLMSTNFRDHFEVMTACDGVEALELLSNNPVDLVITDVLMPKMDGLTLCKTIRSTPEINHVNILVLTAKNNPEDRIDCYNAGADGYISKPFEMEVLEARVFNLYEKRKQVIESFRKNYRSDIETLSYNPIDQAFINSAIEVIQANLEIELDLEKFATLMNASKSTLHRKFKYLTGLSPCEFVKNYKLKIAREMLTSRIGYVSEIAYSVGYSCPKYFSRCFKNEFGVTPSEYRESIWKEIDS